MTCTTTSANPLLLARLGINSATLNVIHPFNELNNKYRNQVLSSSEIIEFEKGDTVFHGKMDRSRYHFLLKGKLKYISGIFQRKTIDSRDEFSKFDITTILPDNEDVMAADAGYLLSVESVMMDAALAWMHARELNPNAWQKNAADEDIPPQKFTTILPAVEASIDKNEDWMSVLLSSPLFFNLPPSNISRFFSSFEHIPVKRGDVIFRQGDPGEEFYVLLSGCAEVIIDDQHEMPIKELRQGSYFGEGALLSGEPRSASVIMTTDGELGRLDRDNFHSLLHDPVIKYISAEEVGQQLLKHKSHCVLVDVRSPEEFAHRPSFNSRNIPFRELRATIPQLDKKSLYFISEEGGKRSELAAHLFSQADLKVFVIRE